GYLPELLYIDAPAGRRRAASSARRRASATGPTGTRPSTAGGPAARRDPWLPPAPGRLPGATGARSGSGAGGRAGGRPSGAAGGRGGLLPHGQRAVPEERPPAGHRLLRGGARPTAGPFLGPVPDRRLLPEVPAAGRGQGPPERLPQPQA